MPPSRPRPTLVYLVRHGKTPSTGKILPGRAPGLHLSDEGLAQATQAAERLHELTTKPKAIYASPLERTKETAAPIAKALGLKTQLAKGLLECDFGDWTGKNLLALTKKKEWAQVQRTPSSFRFPNGESFTEMTTRAYGTVMDLAAANRGRSIVLVSHADPIKAILQMALGAPLDLFQRLTVSPCSISVLVISDGIPHVLTMNSTGSLKELARS